MFCRFCKVVEFWLFWFPIGIVGCTGYNSVMKSPANILTNQILSYLFFKGVFAWRNSVGAFGGMRANGDKMFLQFGKVGSPDIIAILNPTGRFFGIEVKIGSDRLRPAQVAFKRQAELCGGLYIVVKDFEGFLKAFAEIGN
jgi:hypothetical protein